MERYRDVILSIDIFYVNGHLFYLSKSKNINYISVKRLKRKGAPEITKCLRKDCDRYVARDFEVTDIHGDNEFATPKIQDALMPIIFHIYA